MPVRHGGSGMNGAVDLFLFLGQSNMAGRGDASEASPVAAGAGYEYRAVSDPARLHPIEDPFGINENRIGGIDDRWGDVNAKSGGLVPAFVNAWYERTGVPVVGVSASKGGSAISEWAPGGKYHEDMLARLDAAGSFLKSEGIVVAHTYALFCQGETDGDLRTDADTYKGRFRTLFSALAGHGVEKIFMILIGRCNIDGRHDDYDVVRNAQKELAEENRDVVIVSRCMETFLERNLMKDAFHYKQQGYEIAGTEAGANTASYVLSLRGKALDQA